jgi:adenine/guanine phosphoribosyltransferase-like PRPP-binding protein
VLFRSKLPAAENDLQKIPIMKEYGDDSLFFRISDLESATPSGGVIEISIFDDILATGGTSEGMAERLNALTVNTPQGPLPVKVKEFVFLAEISVLKGKERLERLAPVKTLISF